MALSPKDLQKHLRKWNGDPRQQFLNADRMLDSASTGPLWLSDPEIAGFAERAMQRGAELGQYVLQAYVIMPNHLHVLLDPLVLLQKLTNGIKGVSARDANVRLGRTGKPFWQDKSLDHGIRDAGQFARAKMYIENNPVKARLRIHKIGDGRVRTSSTQPLLAVWFCTPPIGYRFSYDRKSHTAKCGCAT